MARSFYDVLRVDRNATLDEIKLAFKKQALQVHPDKGGSKEAFHLVYQALETLSDPETRRHYDHRLKSNIPSGRSAKSHKRASERPSSVPRNFGNDPPSECSPTKQTRWMRKIHELLKKLPRDVRNEVIKMDFSQKQRLYLEKWMKETFSENPSPPSNVDVQSLPEGSCKSLAVSKPESSSKMSRRKCGKHTARKSSNSFSTKKACGCIRKNRSSGHGGSYVAVIRFDAVHIEMWTAKCDLSTALEYLLLLTSVKQKMLDGRETAAWAERLQAALVSSAREQGKDYSELNIRFCLVYSFRFWSRDCLEPFRRTMQKNLLGRGSIYWCYSPPQLLEVWEKFQRIVTDTWEKFGLDSASTWA